MKATEILEKLQNVFLSAEAEVSEAPVEEVKEELSSEEVVENVELEAQEEVSEEVVEKTRSEVDRFLRDKGEEAVVEVGIGRIHPDLVKLLGRLHFRTSY